MTQFWLSFVLSSFPSTFFALPQCLCPVSFRFQDPHQAIPTFHPIIHTSWVLGQLLPRHQFPAKTLPASACNISLKLLYLFLSQVSCLFSFCNVHLPSPCYLCPTEKGHELQKKRHPELSWPNIFSYLETLWTIGFLCNIFKPFKFSAAWIPFSVGLKLFFSASSSIFWIWGISIFPEQVC